MFDMLVLAYRLDPRVLGLLRAHRSFQETLSEVLTRASDRSLAREVGLPLLPARREPAFAEALTVREQDVYELVREGRSNSNGAGAGLERGNGESPRSQHS